MAIDIVREHLKKWNMEDKILEFPVSSATVELAAEAAGVIPARICKTISFKDAEGCILVETAGDAKIDNGKFKAAFGLKAKMLTPEEVLEYTGHEVGGVCAFGIKRTDVRVFADTSLKRFTTVFPACGSSNSAVELTPDVLFEMSGAIEWVDVCKEWSEICV
ncbi:proline--tRNA ligase [Clostridia bacterium]|nr:proline--tRNA ligase [Clostridia bacterium]